MKKKFNDNVVTEKVMNKFMYAIVITVLLLQSCASKKDILYFQNNDIHGAISIQNAVASIEPNDILSITVGTKIPEAAMAYNIQSLGNNNIANAETVRLEGYLVSPQSTITFPVLGTISVLQKTTSELESDLKEKLETEGHLVDPIVRVRILNSKVTILGEVNKPGTYSFSEQTLTIPQALGYAGDLTINGQRKDILLIRESKGIRTIKHIDLTSVNWMNDSSFNIRQNDVLIINPNSTKVKTSGYIGNASTILTIVSLALSSIILLTR
ncbi:polysaccharide biosynthesis/export family protein [Flavobacterium sp. DG2-3]|uniref:polysaccharide biosynthesis/export family protein n=1 Tax=Flavobacterium sp. DG2-3 TaxID=3068317 RepID=UPI00273FDC1C|nr:polysaccharide biosynthesis/export family protein [Flavobacterium sp. DG2-3]MDP5199128.1 polysaccharide biosynthesis/export family protein [Flavobacterium sp. DG2-3]